MCTRFVYNGKDTITGFNFDIDLSVWDHKVIKDENRFYIGIKMPDSQYHSFHGIHRNGNAGTLLYVHGNPQGRYDAGSYTIADLTENYIRGLLSFDDATGSANCLWAGYHNAGHAFRQIWTGASYRTWNRIPA